MSEGLLFDSSLPQCASPLPGIQSSSSRKSSQPPPPPRHHPPRALSRRVWGRLTRSYRHVARASIRSTFQTTPTPRCCRRGFESQCGRSTSPLTSQTSNGRIALHKYRSTSIYAPGGALPRKRFGVLTRRNYLLTTLGCFCIMPHGAAPCFLFFYKH